MVKSSVRFERGDGYWVAERDSIGFTGTTDFGPVEFLITSEALAEMLNPELEGIDPETAVEVFIEFESDIHRIAQREFVKRLGGEPPILLTRFSVEVRSRSNWFNGPERVTIRTHVFSMPISV
jgi:hypothetical protein